MKIILKEFPTHIEKTNNKVAPNKMLKVNNQAIYNGYINRFTRNIVMSNLHNYIKDVLKLYKPLILKETICYPISIKIIIYTVKNHGNISMRNGKLCWKPAKIDYKPNWDIENLASIWIKAISDSLVQIKILPEDNIDYINKISYEYREIEDIKDRQIVIKIS